MDEIMGNTLGSLFTCPSGLLQRRWRKLGVTIKNFFLWSNSPNFWVAPRMYGVHPQKMNMMIQNMLGMNNWYRYLIFDLLYCDSQRNKCFSKTNNAAVTVTTTNTRVHSGLWTVNMKSYIMHITEDMKLIRCSKFWTGIYRTGKPPVVFLDCLSSYPYLYWSVTEFTSPACYSISLLEFTCLASEVHQLLLSDKATENCFQWHHVVYILPNKLFSFEGCLLSFTSIVWHVTTDCGNLKSTVWCCLQWHNVCTEFHKDVKLFPKLMWETHRQHNDHINHTSFLKKGKWTEL
jgi:hypothetical protein